jgi:hypothetical protein
MLMWVLVMMWVLVILFGALLVVYFRKKERR